MAQKYYNTADAAKVFGISVDEVKAMLDRRELHGYRDGADWKFKVEDIDRVAEERRAGQASSDAEAEEEGDVLLSEVALGHSDLGTSGTVLAMESIAEGTSDIQLAGSDIKLADSDATPIPKKKDAVDSKVAKFEALSLDDDDVAPDDSSPTLRSIPIPAGMGGPAIDLSGKGLADDDLVLGGSGSDVAIGADSGISLVNPGDTGLSLEKPLGGSSERLLESLSQGVPAAASSGGGGETDFMLSPLEDVGEGESSDSGSQVIALDSEADEAGTLVDASAAASMAAIVDEDVSGEPGLDMGLGLSAVVAATSPSFVSRPAVREAAVPAPAPTPTMVAAYEAPYTPWQLTGLAACSVLLMFCGMVMFDLLRHIWSWGTPYAVNSWLMDLIVGK